MQYTGWKDDFQKMQNSEFCTELQADIHCFLSFADFFFYGFAEDHLQASEIGDARLQVEDAIERVEYILAQMEHSRKKFS